jgi:hypothetical protein
VEAPLSIVVLPRRAPAVPERHPDHPAGSRLAPLPHDALALIAEGLAKSARFDTLPLDSGEERRYLRLLETPSYDAWLIAWRATGTLQLHDHGGSTGAVHVAEGELVETYTDSQSRHPLRSRVITAGSPALVPSDRIHEVWNPGPDQALSVHVYSPPLTAMTFYDHRPERFLAPLRTRRGDLATLDDG